MKRTFFSILGASTFLSLVLIPSAQADTISWEGTTGDWGMDDNWENNQVPESFDQARIDNGGTAQVTDTRSVQNVVIGRTATGTLEIISGGHLTTDSSVALGEQGGANGTLRISGGALTINDLGGGANLNIGSAVGTGTVVLSNNGTLALDGEVYLDGGGVLKIGEGGAAGTLTGASAIVGGVLSGSGQVIFNHNEAGYTVDTQIGVGFANSISVTHNGSGTTILTGLNEYTLGTTLDAGTLSVSQNANLGNATGTLTFNGGTLQTTGTFTMNRGTTLNAGGGTFSTNTGTTLIQDGAISGAGGLTKTGAGRLILTGTNTYGGGTTVTAGTLVVYEGSISHGTSGVRVGTSSGPVATFDITRGGSVTSGLSEVGSGGAGVATVSKSGSAWNLTDHLYVGASSLAELHVEEGGSVDVTNNLYIGNGSAVSGTVTVNGAGSSLAAAGMTVGVNGPGTLNLEAGGTATVNGGTGTLTLGGGTVVDGTLNIGTGGAAGTLEAVAVTTGVGTGTGKVNFNHTDDITFAPAIQSAIAVTKLGSGTTTLTGTNTYTGGTTIDAGTLSVGTNANLGNASGTLTFGGGTLKTTGTFTMSRGTTLNAGGGTFSPNSGTTLTQNGLIGGTGGLTKAGAGTLVLGGNNTYEGGTTLSGGNLRIGHNNALGTGTLKISSGTLSASAPRAVANNIEVNGDFNVYPGGSLVTVSAFNLNGNVDLKGATRTVTSLSDFQVFDFGVANFGGVISNGGLTLNAARPAEDNVVFFSMTGSGSNTYAGLTTVGTSASLNLAKTGGATAIAGDLTIEDNGVAVVAGPGEQIADTATVTVNGIGRLEVGVATDVTETIGTLDGDGQVDLSDNTTGSTIRVGAGTFSGVITGGVEGPGQTSLVKYGSGTLTLTGASTYLGGTEIANGTLSMASGGSISHGSSFMSIGTVSGQTGTLSIGAGSSVTSGRAYVGNAGTGVANVSGSGAEWDLTELLYVGASGTGSLNITSGGAVDVEGDFYIGNNPEASGTVTVNGTGSRIDATIGGIYVGQAGTGVFNLENEGAATVNGGSGTLTLGAVFGGMGTLNIGAYNLLAATEAGTLEASQVTVGSGTGVVNFNQTDATSFGASIKNTASVNQRGTGVTTLTGTNTYTGATTVSGGTLRVNGSLGNTAVTVQNGGTLGGTGSIAGAVTVQNGGILAPGASPGTLTVGALVLNSTSRLDFELDTPGVVGGGVNDLIVVNGNLTLDGMLKVTPLAGFGVGTYRLINYTGSLTDEGLSFAKHSVAYEFTVSTATANQVNLQVAAADAQYWDGPNNDPTGTPGGSGGTGMWNSGETNWTNSAGTNNGLWSGTLAAIFGGTAGTVTINDGYTASAPALSFLTDGYEIASSSGGKLRLTDDALVEVMTDVTAEISAPVIGTEGLAKIGEGALVLSGANTYTGSTVVREGTLEVTGSVSHATDIAVIGEDDGDEAALIVSGGGTVESLEGFLALNEGSSGTATVTGTGSEWKNNGLLYVGYSGGGMLNVGDGGKVVSTGGVIGFFGDGGAVVTGAGSAWEATSLGVGILGDGALRIENGGKVTVGGGTGLVTLAAQVDSLGDLIIGSGASAGTLEAGEVTGGSGTARVIFNHNEAAYIFAPELTGSLSVIQRGTGTTVLGTANTYTGGTLLEDGTLRATVTGALGTGPVSVTGGSFLEFDGAGVGAGSLAITNDSSGGTFFLNGASAVGAQIVNRGGGYTTLASGSNAGGARITNESSGGFFLFTDSDASGAMVVNRAGGVVDISGLRYGTTAAAGIGSLSGAGNVFLGLGTLTLGALNGNDTISGVIADGGNDGGTGGSLVKIGAGTLTLTGANTYTGTTAVNNGKLVVNGSLASSTVTVSGAGVLGGSGTLGGSLVNNGLVAPGNSPGKLTIAGNYVQGPGGTLGLEIAGKGAGQYDQLDIGGTAALDGTLFLDILGGYAPKDGDSFDFIKATGGLSGKFAQVDTNLQNALKFDLLYASDGLSATIKTVQGSFTPFASTGNQSAVAGALNQQFAADGTTPLISALNKMPGSSLAGAFNEISPDKLAPMWSMPMANARGDFRSLDRRMIEVRMGRSGTSLSAVTLVTPEGTMDFGAGTLLADAGTGASGTPGLKTLPVSIVSGGDANPWGFYVSGAGGFGDVESDGNGTGYTFDTAGVTLGVDNKFEEDKVLGFMAGYSNSSADLGGSGGDVNVDTAKFGVYGGWFNDSGTYANGLIRGAWNGYETQRNVLGQAATGDTNGYEFDTYVSGGHDFTMESFKTGPVGGLGYNLVNTDGFTENGSLAPLAISQQTAQSLRSNLGWRASYSAEWLGVTLVPEGRIAWEHEFLNPVQGINAQFANAAGTFGVQTTDVGRDYAVVGLGMTAIVTEAVSASLNYDAEAGSEVLIQRINGAVTVKF